MRDVREYRDKWLLFTEDTQLKDLAERHLDAYEDIMVDAGESYANGEKASTPVHSFQRALAQQHLVKARESLEQLRTTQEEMETIKPFLKDAFIRTEDIDNRRATYENTVVEYAALSEGLEPDNYESWSDVKEDLENPEMYEDLVPRTGFPDSV